MKNSIKLQNKGFTLVELLATIVILGILAVMVAPLAIKYLGKAKEDVFKIQDSKIKEATKLYYDDCVNGNGDEINTLETTHNNVCDEFTGIIEYHNGETADGTLKNTCVTLEKLVYLGYMDPVYVDGGLYSANVYLATESKSDVSYEIMPNRCYGFMPGEVSSSIEKFSEEGDDEVTSALQTTDLYNYNRTCQYITTSDGKLSTYDDTDKTDEEIRAECQGG